MLLSIAISELTHINCVGWEQKLYSIIIIISINAQVFIEMCTLWLVTDHIISHHKQEVIIAGALNFKMAAFCQCF